MYFTSYGFGFIDVNHIRWLLYHVALRQMNQYMYSFSFQLQHYINYIINIILLHVYNVNYMYCIHTSSAVRKQ